MLPATSNQIKRAKDEQAESLLRLRFLSQIHTQIATSKLAEANLYASATQGQQSQSKFDHSRSRRRAALGYSHCPARPFNLPLIHLANSALEPLCLRANVLCLMHCVFHVLSRISMWTWFWPVCVCVCVCCYYPCP